MKLAYFGINIGPCADPDVARRVARAAEAAGLESLWTGEHVVLPDPQVPPSPSPPEVPFLDPAVALAWVAAVTTTSDLIPAVLFGPGGAGLHSHEEYVNVDDVRVCRDVLVATARALVCV